MVTRSTQQAEGIVDRQHIVVMASKHRSYYFFESGGHPDPATTIGLPPLCTVGAAELAPPALGRIALFPIAIDVFSSALADVPDREVVQLTSGLPLDGAVDWAAKGTADDQPNKAAIAMRSIFFFIPGAPFSVYQRKPSVDVIVPSWATFEPVELRARTFVMASFLSF